MSKIDLKDRVILEELTENSRVPVSKIAKKLKCSPKTVKARLDILEKEHLIKYTLLFDEEELNLEFHLILVKLKENFSEAEISDAIKLSKIPQFCAVTKGSFDLVIYTCSKSRNEFDMWSVDFRRKMNKYIINWLPISIITRRFGFFPLRDEVISELDMPSQKKEIIRILNKNSRTPIKDIAGKLKLSSPTVKYHIDRILKSKIIKKGTITFESNPVHLLILQKLNFPDNFEELNYKGRQFWIENLNSISCIFRLGGNYDLCVMYSAKSIDHAYSLEKENYSAWKSISGEFISAIVLKVLIGEISFNPYRKKEEYSTPEFLK